MERRGFLCSIGGAAAAAAIGAGSQSAGAAQTGEQLERRLYGPALSVIGMGGIVVMNVEQTEADEAVAWAVDHGVNYFDVAPSYGNAEERLGPALEPYRKDAFLACKTVKRDAAGAQTELEQSLKTLRTDYFDLYQFHGFTKPEEVEQALGPGGAIETFMKAREKGLIRHIGFSAHSVAAAEKAMDMFHFDSVLFPFNCVCMLNGNFGPQILNRAIAEGTACLALKAMAWTKWAEGEQRTHPKAWYRPITDPELADLAVRYTLSLPVTAAVPPGDVGSFKLAVQVATGFKPLSEDEERELTRRLQGVEPIFRHEE